jgi:hypothetical protein
MCKRRLWKRAAVSIEAPLEKLERTRFTGDSERHMMEGFGNRASLSIGSLPGEPGKRAPLLGTLKNM